MFSFFTQRQVLRERHFKMRANCDL